LAAEQLQEITPLAKCLRTTAWKTPEMKLSLNDGPFFLTSAIPPAGFFFCMAFLMLSSQSPSNSSVSGLGPRLGLEMGFFGIGKF
jgi:hypothetical protein